MDKTIFSIYLGNPDNDNGTALDLPAKPWAMMDALEMLRLREGQEPYLWDALRHSRTRHAKGGLCQSGRAVPEYSEGAAGAEHTSESDGAAGEV